MMAEDTITRNNFNIIPLELKLLDYGHNQTSYHLVHIAKSSMEEKTVIIMLYLKVSVLCVCSTVEIKN